MNDISIFLANNYMWFIIIDILLVFALIGYLFDSKRRQKEIEKTEILDTIKYNDAPETIEELKEQVKDNSNASLNETINKNNAQSVSDKTEVMDIPVVEENKEESTIQS